MKTRVFLLVVLVLFASVQLSYAQDKGKCGPDLTYKIEKKKRNAKATSVVGGSSIRYELKITGRGDMTDAPWQAVKDKNIESVLLPDHLTSIADHAFEDIIFRTPTRIGLSHGELVDKTVHEALEIPNSVTRIGDYAFHKCRFDYAPFIPDEVRYIGKEAFAESNIYWLDADDWSYPADVIGGYGLEEIGDKAFYSSNVPSFGICKDVKRIGKYVFAKNTTLYGIVIKKGLEVLSEGTFFGCSNLDYVSIKESSLRIIGSKAFENCTSLESIELPPTTETIGERAFLGCSSLNSISLPGSVKTIERYAFWGCNNLNSIIIPDSVSSVGEGTLAYCHSLSSIRSKWSSRDDRCLIVNQELRAFAPSQLSKYTIPDEVKSIAEYSFAGCNELSEITLPVGLEVIGRYAFQDCDGITRISIPNGVTTIKRGAFESCDNLEMVIIPSSVKVIEDDAFKDCSKLQYICVMNNGLVVGKNLFPSNAKVYYTDSNNAPAILAIQDLSLEDQYRTNAINGGTSNYVGVSIKNEGSGYGSATVRILMSGNTAGLSSSAVSVNVYPNEDVIVRVPVNADYNVATGYVNLRVQLTVENGFSYGNDLLRVPTQAHGIPAEMLSDNGRKYKRSAEELLNKAKNVDGLLLTIKEYEHLTQSDPNYADAYFNLGKLYTSLAKIKGSPYFDKAVDNFRMFIKLLPEERQIAEDEIYAVQSLKKNYKDY